MNMYPINDNFQSIYIEILEDILHNGKELGKTIDKVNLDFCLTNPNNCLISLNKNWKWGFAELSDRLDPYYRNPGTSYLFRPNWKRKLEKEGGKWIYNYSEYLVPAIPKVLKKLKARQEREAIISIWQPEHLDIIHPRPRTPCTLNLHFLIRENKVLLFVNMRSSDVINLLPYDVLHHTFLQRYIASMLELEPGNFYLKASHYYCHKKRIIKKGKGKRKERSYIENTVFELNNAKQNYPENNEYNFEDFTQSLGTNRKDIEYDMAWHYEEKHIFPWEINYSYKTQPILFLSNFLRSLWKKQYGEYTITTST